MNPIEQALKDLQDTLIVSTEIQRRHAETLKDHEDALNDLYKVYATHNKMLNAANRALLDQFETNTTTRETIARLDAESAKLRRESEQFRLRTEQNLAEITDKLNGLIGYVAGLQPPKQS